MKLIDVLKPENIIQLDAKTREEALQMLAHQAAKDPMVFDEESLLEGVKEREAQNTTGIGMGLAVPHCRTDWVDGVVVVMGVAKQPIDFRSLDGKPVSVIVLVAAGAHNNKDYIQILSSIALFWRDKSVRASIEEASGAGEIYEIIKAASEGDS